jgi:3-phosphoshikimate 1-carboxyvinyltransferase
MKISIEKSQIKGTVKAPSSKSYTIRGLMCAALARGESIIVSPLRSDDTDAAMSVLRQIGAEITMEDGLWRVSGGDFHAPDVDLCCGDSAATLRFMCAICSLVPGRCRLTAGPSLAKRPVKPLVEALRQLEVQISCEGDFPPVTVDGGELKGGIVDLPGNISSQYVSALLMASPLSQNGVTVNLTTSLESRNYVLMTLECMAKFGIDIGFSTDLCEFAVKSQAYMPTEYRVEGDWSSASYLLALGALSGAITVTNLKPNSSQGDKILLDFLRQMGADVSVEGDSVTVKKGKLRAIKADLNECIDLLPTVAVLAAVAEGTSGFNGIQRARLKESDRVAAVKEGLERAGAAVQEEENRLVITGSKIKDAIIDSYGDHRIAMAFSLLGAAAGGITIAGAECVSKTYPEFWEVLKSTGGEVKIDG